MWIYYRLIMYQNNADEMANSVDHGQTAPLIWVYTVCSGLSVWKPRNIMVHVSFSLIYKFMALSKSFSLISRQQQHGKGQFSYQDPRGGSRIFGLGFKFAKRAFDLTILPTFIQNSPCKWNNLDSKGGSTEPHEPPLDPPLDPALTQLIG